LAISATDCLLINLFFAVRANAAMTWLGRRQRRTTIPAKHSGRLDHLLAEGALAQIVGLWVVDRGRSGLLPLALSVVG
jgi:hypothetical protein